MKKRVVEELMASGMSRTQASDAFDQVSRAIARMVARGDSVRIPDIGILTRRTRAESRRRLPHSGETITISSHDTVAIRNPRRF